MSGILIAIDGTAGAGKGTLAYHLAKIYNLAHLDTGLLYRAVGLKMLEKGKDFSDTDAAIKIASSLSLEDCKNPRLREEAVGVAASYVGPISEVRKILLAFQRNFAFSPPQDKQGVVVDGRDIGRVVLPEAPCKIFVIASPQVRAERRLKEMLERGISCTYDSILEDIKTRDERDQTRKASPLKPAEDAYVLDTSCLTIKECVEKACQYVDSKYPEGCKY